MRCAGDVKRKGYARCKSYAYCAGESVAGMELAAASIAAETSRRRLIDGTSDAGGR